MKHTSRFAQLKSAIISIMAISFISQAAQAIETPKPTNPSGSSASTGQQQVNGKKKWTVLVFMNGHNNLGPYTQYDLNEMEAVGSNDLMNIVVQVGRGSQKENQRLYVTKDSDPQNVHSQVIESFPRVDMGDYRELQKFLEWGVKNYPAEHYFVNVWNHGNGWMKSSSMNVRKSGFETQNISYDDISNNSISIPDLGLALKAATITAGQKIDIYGSDACLMAMVEVGNEIAPYVDIMVGSEELEPMDGWQYSDFLKAWNAAPESDAIQIGKILTDTYINSYASGSRPTTFSVVDLTQMESFNKAFSDFGMMLLARNQGDAQLILLAAKEAESYHESDYVDLMGFMNNLERSLVGTTQDTRFKAMKEIFSKTVVYNKNQRRKGLGLAIWIPEHALALKNSTAEYDKMSFNKETGWLTVLESLFKEAAVTEVSK